MKKYRSLVINPGSTSTKIGVFEDLTLSFEKNIGHTPEQLAPFADILDQLDFRKRAVLDALEQAGIDLSTLDFIMARGGVLRPIPSGTYRINEQMLSDLRTSATRHASNIAAFIAQSISQDLGGIPCYIADPVVVDEMEDVARLSGHPDCPRKSIFHALNQKATARLHCDRIGIVYEKANLVVAHLGGGISVAAHKQGRVVDLNNALDGDGPFAPDRAGSIPSSELIKVCFSGQYTKEELLKFISSKGGLVAYLGTNSVIQVMERIAQGDQRAKKVLDAMCYNIVKQIGAMAAALSGSVQTIVLTGGIAYNEPVVEYIRERCSFIAPIAVYPGENELEALVTNALVVLRGVITPKVYK